MTDKNITSVSDTDIYREVCRSFASDDLAFSTFKQNPIYTAILEHTTKQQALQYIEYIKSSKLDLSKIGILKSNDEQGSPTIEIYGDETFDGISPSTIRYIKVLSEIVDIFGHLDGMNVVEIGVGYGGQCKILNDYFDIKSYQLVDLPEVLYLSEKYLSKYGYEDITFSDKNKDKYDFLISNYAITECSKDVQINYINNFVNKSRHGYITCNYISDVFNIDSMTKEEFLSMIDKKVALYEETPLTHSNNCLMVW